MAVAILLPCNPTVIPDSRATEEAYFSKFGKPGDEDDGCDESLPGWQHGCHDASGVALHYNTFEFCCSRFKSGPMGVMACSGVPHNIQGS